MYYKYIYELHTYLILAKMTEIALRALYVA